MLLEKIGYKREEGARDGAPKILSLFVLFISVISMTGTWQIKHFTEFDVSCRSSNMYKN